MEEALIKRVLPHNTEAEQLVIGCMLMDKEAISAASEIIHSDDFYGRQYGAMFEAITELYNEGKPTDLVAVQEQLKTKDVPPESYSISAFRELLNMVPTSVNIRYYANLVYEKALLRRLIRIMKRLQMIATWKKKTSIPFWNQQKSVFLVFWKQEQQVTMCRYVM